MKKSENITNILKIKIIINIMKMKFNIELNLH